MSQKLVERVAANLEEVATRFLEKAKQFTKEGKPDLALYAQKQSDYWFGLAEDARRCKKNE